MKGNKPPKYGICIYIYYIPEMAIDDMTKGIWKEMAYLSTVQSHYWLMRYWVFHKIIILCSKYGDTMWGPQDKLSWFITPITMVYGTYNYS